MVTQTIDFEEDNGEEVTEKIDVTEETEEQTANRELNTILAESSDSRTSLLRIFENLGDVFPEYLVKAAEQRLEQLMVECDDDLSGEKLKITLHDELNCEDALMQLAVQLDLSMKEIEKLFPKLIDFKGRVGFFAVESMEIQEGMNPPIPFEVTAYPQMPAPPIIYKVSADESGLHVIETPHAWSPPYPGM